MERNSRWQCGGGASIDFAGCAYCSQGKRWRVDGRVTRRGRKSFVLLQWSILYSPIVNQKETEWPRRGSASKNHIENPSHPPPLHYFLPQPISRRILWKMLSSFTGWPENPWRILKKRCMARIVSKKPEESLKNPLKFGRIGPGEIPRNHPESQGSFMDSPHLAGVGQRIPKTSLSSHNPKESIWFLQGSSKPIKESRGILKNQPKQHHRFVQTSQSWKLQEKQQ